MRRLVLSTIAALTLVCAASAAQAQSSGPTMGFFGGGGMSVANFCYWYPHQCRNGRIVGSQPCYISIRLENGARQVPCRTFLDKQQRGNRAIRSGNRSRQ
jgi:hypothetical protein